MLKNIYLQILLGCAQALPAQSVQNIDSLNIDPEDRISLAGEVHPALRGRLPLGPADPSLRLERVLLAFRMRPEARERLEALLQAQQDPASPLYHAWIGPEEFGRRFGPSKEEIAAAAAWLEGQGLEVGRRARGGMSLEFSGTVASVQRAFRVPLQRFGVDGEPHLGNGADPSLPRALAQTVAGVVSLNDFRRRTSHAAPRAVPEFTVGLAHYLAPADFGAIYGLPPASSEGPGGAGVTVAVVGRSNPGLTDVAAWRSAFGLPAGRVSVVLNGQDPGMVSFDEVIEADLDLQWAGAAAPGAAVALVCSASTSTTDGVDLSSLYAVDNEVGSVVSLSFGECEAMMGPTELAFYANLWAQAAAEGITVCVASGDSGAAGCQPGASASGGTAGVNGLSSTPYDTCVGGTLLEDAGGAYWNGANAPDGSSALGYIPEAAWNESGAAPGGSGLWAGGGGASAVYAKPAWQAGPGVPQDGRRDVPDLAFSAAVHDAYLMRALGSLYAVGGTSASTPAFAGIAALLVQRTGQRQGSLGPLLYRTASRQAQGGPAAFHDVQRGGNSVPGTPGFQAGPGFDPATGLGSLDAQAFLGAQSSLSTSPAGVETQADLGAPFSQGFTVSGGTAPYAWTLAQGPLPPGLALDPSGTLSGTLSAEGTFPFSLAVTDAAGRSGGAFGRVTVGPVTVTFDRGAVGQLAGSTHDYHVTVAGAVDTGVTWSATAGTVAATGPASAAFTADASGLCGLTATSSAVPGRSASITVDVHDADFENHHAGSPLTGLDALFLAGSLGNADPLSDLDGDGVVGPSDLAQLLALLGW